jgi:DNA modification methylase
MGAEDMESPTPLEPLTPKRLKSDAGIDALYPYYAGFSTRFAVQTLRDLALRKGAVVLDPWNGSGTTTTAAASLGFHAVGVDLNPFAGVIASAKLARRGTSDRFCDIAGKLSGKVAGDDWPTDDDDPLHEWLPASSTRYVRELVRAIGLNTKKPARTGSVLAIALARALRPLATAPTKNPTWNVPSGRKLTPGRITAGFREQLRSVTDSLRSGRTGQASILTGDARDLAVEDGTVDAVLTSPPYLTRIDYATKTNFELALLGMNLDDTLRAGLMGTTALRPKARIAIPRRWPVQLKAALSRVRHHPSHRSEEYYFRNILQYFDDAAAALGEIYRVLVKGGAALLVLQDSYYKELHVDLPQLFVALGQELGFRGEILRREPVGRVMTSVNTASRTYLPQRTYTESVVRLTKDGT